jgi:hypothetical protein
MTVGRLLAEADSAELSGWMEWEEIHGPLGTERGDYLAAGMIKTMVDLQRAAAGAKSGSSSRVQDFLLFALPGAAGPSRMAITTPEGFAAWAAMAAAAQARLSR